jgi:hypothetical protein
MYDLGLGYSMKNITKLGTRTPLNFLSKNIEKIEESGVGKKISK